MSDELTDIAIEELRRLSDVLELEADNTEHTLCFQCGVETENEEFCSTSCQKLFDMDGENLREQLFETGLDEVFSWELDKLNS